MQGVVHKDYDFYPQRDKRYCIHEARTACYKKKQENKNELLEIKNMK